MAVAPFYLADTSVLARMGDQRVVERVAPLLVDGLVATCPIIDLEVMYSARSLQDFEGLQQERSALTSYAIDLSVTNRAMEVQHLLAQRGEHRLPLQDLLIAAVAELNDLAVLHYDADYERIAAVSGLRATWVVPRGSV